MWREKQSREAASQLDLEEALQASRNASHPYSTHRREWPPLLEVGDTGEFPSVCNTAGGEGTALDFFPKIRRVWASVDNSLFLWRFNKRDGQCQDICALFRTENNASCLPKWCNDNNDVKLPHCQILGKYRMELSGYNTMEPHPHTNEHCSSLRDCVQRMTWCNDPRICDKVHFKYICKERECDSSLSSLN
ncbi:hypothetical protein Bca52824_086732 [Brassica carinata]|uniref:Uncharacterized protein n=1 Tax=Brassica carinata TaxID=52824 RepID=A0A8X7PCC1_BRACI|nr:hypothetical protein Bca52824_086732 [Brassica carinata]